MSVQERYAPGRPFPPYAFVPGHDADSTPHPTRHPEGHSYGAPPEARYLEPRRWHENEDYLFGVDLYNHGYLWEAHEAWEGLWHRAKHDELQAEHLQGLIQCAAAALKVPMGQPRGLAQLAELGTGRLERVAREGSPIYMGIDLSAFVAAFRAFAASQPDTAEERPPIVLSPA